METYIETYMETYTERYFDFLNEQNKTKFLNHCNNLIQELESRMVILSKKGDDSKYILGFYQLYIKILKMDKLATSVNNNPLLMSKIHDKYQECFSDMLVVLEDAVKANDIDENFYLECANACKKQYLEFKRFFINDLKTY